MLNEPARETHDRSGRTVLARSQRQMERMRADNTGPVWFKAGDAINSPCLYEVADLDRWVMEQKGKA